MVQLGAAGNLFLFASTVALINAQNTDDYMPVYRAGPYNFSAHESSVTASLYEQAAANPNATRSIEFRPFYWWGGSDPYFYQNMEWTWRVNVSDFPAANAEPETKDGAALVDPHVVLNTYDLSWTRSGNLSNQFSDEDTPVCITALTSYTWPANVTNRYPEGDTDSGDCGAVLGDECRDAITSAGSSVARDCGGPMEAWATLPECASSFGYAHSQSQYAGLLTFDLNAANGTRAQSQTNETRVPGGIPNPTSGTGFYAFNSRPRNATNMTDYYEATNRLHVVMINVYLPISPGRISKPTLLCMRVNTTNINEDDNSSTVRTAGLNTLSASLVGVVMLLVWFL